MELDPLFLLLLLIAVPAAFTLSSSAGLGGSLILVPSLAAILGAKEGIALAALLLAANNIAKLASYRRTLPVRAAILIALTVMAGAAIGAGLMISAPESWVTALVIAAILATFAADLLKLDHATSASRKGWAAVLAFTSGASSGFSGMSGPLKGVALRSIGLQRQWFVGAAAMVSLAGDATKAAVFSHAGLLTQSEWLLAAGLIPVMIASTLLGRRINQQVGERGYAVLFWAVMLGYTGRLVLSS